MSKKKLSKTNEILINLTREESDAVGVKVEALIKKEMAYIVNQYIVKYNHAVADTFGWDRDDLLQNIRMAMWKGVATFNPDYGFKIETYLSSILSKTFSNISRQCKTQKHSRTKLYCPENFYESEEIIFRETGEDWVRYAQSFAVLMGTLNRKEQKVMVRYLIHGETTSEISEKSKIKKTEVVKILKEIKEKIKNFMGGTYG
jgi:RNA polymerase sigma factor (sigma-70 family)